MTDTELYASVGGKLVTQAPDGTTLDDPVWYFGWIPEAWRDDAAKAAHESAERAMNTAAVFGRANDDADFANMTALWNHPAVVAALGFPFTGSHQLTGSCVGAGMDNVVQSLNFNEVLLLKQPEKIFLCFYPYHYGRGRLKSGMRGRGEGSTGSGQAQAVKDDGVLDNAMTGLPKPLRTDDGIIWGDSVEMAWSAGDRIEEVYLAEGRRHPITDVAKLRNHDEVRLAIVNGKPVTCASMYAFKARVEGEGKEACLLGRKQGSWSHQMSIHAYWKHPRLGPLFWLHNQWGLNAHGRCPTGMPPGGAWITGADVDWICRDEVYAFAGHSGWVTPTIDWFI